MWTTFWIPAWLEEASVHLVLRVLKLTPLSLKILAQSWTHGRNTSFLPWVASEDSGRVQDVLREIWEIQTRPCLISWLAMVLVLDHLSHLGFPSPTQPLLLACSRSPPALPPGSHCESPRLHIIIGLHPLGLLTRVILADYSKLAFLIGTSSWIQFLPFLGSCLQHGFTLSHPNPVPYHQDLVLFIESFCFVLDLAV